LSPRLLAALCLFLSGAGSLVLEVVWTRLLRLVFGSTTLAVSTVLVAYMLGLGLGGLLGGRLAGRIRNGLRAYGWLEVGIGLYAAAVPWLLDLLQQSSRGLLSQLSFWPAALFRFVVILALLLLPTVCMGATLPLLVSALVRTRATLARSVGLLYGVNTLGAVSGVFLATFALFPAVGVRTTNAIGAALDLIVGLFALTVAAPRLEQAPDEAHQPGAPAEAIQNFRRWNPALLAYGTVGFTALVYEVCWTRALSMILGSSIYAFATMLASFLTGIALGSLVARRWFDRLQRPVAVYGGGLALLGVLSIATLYAFRLLPSVFIGLVGFIGLSRSSVVLTSVSVSMLAMLAPTLVLGALFPLLTRALAATDHSRTVGDVYFVNTFGSALGAFLAGFVLVPALGLRRTMALAMTINFLAAAAVLLWQRQWTGAARSASVATAVAAALLIGLFPPAWMEQQLTAGVYRFPAALLDVGIDLLPLTGVADDELLFYREGMNTTVSVHRSDGEISLRVNGKADASTGDDMGTQVLLGQIPMLFGRRPEEVLIIGLASAMTVGSVALHEPDRIDVIELEPAMVEASHFFDEVNGRPLEKPFVRVIADDGRVFLSTTDRSYDLIISEPSNPWITGASSLFTREFFHAAHKALQPDGHLCQWVQLYGIDPVRLRAIIAALRAEFRYVYGFHDRAEDTDLVLLGSDAPLSAAELPRWEKLSPKVRQDLERISIFSTADLWSLLRLSAADVDAIAAEATLVNSDDNMAVELESPWRLWDEDVAPENLHMMEAYRRGFVDIFEAGGEKVDGRMVGEVALSFASGRKDEVMARALAGLARERGESTYADLAEARLDLAPDVDEVPKAVVTRLRQAVADRPDSFHAHLLLADALNRIDEPDEALEQIDAALRLQPGDLRARFTRLEILLALARSEEAREEATSLLSTPIGRVGDVSLYAAVSAADSGKVDQGLRQMQTVIDRNPGVPSYWSALAQLYGMSGRREQALEAQANAERARRNVFLGLHRKALREERLFSNARAIETLQLVVQLDPEYEPALRDLERLGAEPLPSPTPEPDDSVS